MEGATRTGRLAIAADAWRTKLWPLPTACVLVSVIAGVGLPQLDRAIDAGLSELVSAWLFSGGPEAARSVLSAIAGSLITVTSLTFSLTVVTLQLASSQFSPRLLRTFARDHVVQGTLGLFLATFAFSLTVLRTVRSATSQGPGFVPQISTTVAVVLALLSVLALVFFLGHLARQIRIETVLETVRRETEETIAETVPDAGDQPAPLPPWVEEVGRGQRIAADSSGFLVAVNGGKLLEAAVDLDAVVLVDRRPGDPVVAGVPLAFALPLEDDGALDVVGLAKRVRAAVTVGAERTAPQDLAFGVRQLVDVAAKALSPGINDPTTAVHALTHLSSLMCRLGNRPLVDDRLCDEEGRVRVVLRRYSYADLLELAVAQTRRYGASEPAVLERLLILLREVAWCTDGEDRRRCVREQLERTRQVVVDGEFDDVDRTRLLGTSRDVEVALAGDWPPSGT
ncbi:putative membrane protein [Kineococcus xinjiangensis]|uniref:Putative membrane protein n=1 Tax=Kineococcus xinjiangensis TaxID=512762 RepID=A0A2S6IEG3_9ACTN|nr:DUF2254 domain-containing protein [Kineococcus xinjiangensis]PPK92608.1 putative membrane protein [Kineococcus xinjiangensis]